MGSEQGPQALPPWEVIESVSYTPSRKQVRALLAALTQAADDKRAGALERALLRQPQAAWAGAVWALASVGPPSDDAPRLARRGRLYKLLGRLLDEQGVGEGVVLAGGLRDAEEAVRRAAARAIGKRWRAPAGERALLEGALLAALADEGSPRVRVALVEALGRVGAEAAEAALVDEAGEAAAQARLLLRRNRSAQAAAQAPAAAGAQPAAGPAPDTTASGVLADAPLGEATEWAWRCRRGLGRLLAAQVEAAGFTVQRAQAAEVLARAPAQAALAWGWRVRVAVGFGLSLRLREVSAGEGALAGAVADALTSDEARALLTRATAQAETLGVRYRLAVEGPRGEALRQVTLASAREAAARAPWLINDPSRRAWDITARLERGGKLRVSLAPRLTDPRFAYRQGDVPAASHPTMAAALAAVAQPQAGDVVWDPFAGSGGELVECGLWAATRTAPSEVTLLGSDLSADALAIAARNIAAAGLAATLQRADALAWQPPARPSLIVTNPPMGRRVQLAQGIDAFFSQCLAAFWQRLPAGGRLVWFAPRGPAVARAATRAGWSVALDQPVDMGGFEVHLQDLRRGGS